MSLNKFLTRLIWVCVLPLVVLAVYLAAKHVQALKEQRDREAGNLACNLAASIDSDLGAQISALQVLADSPLLDDPPRLDEYYAEARGFLKSFGCHIVLADLSMQMVFNTRSSFGATLPKLPRPKGHAAAPEVLKTGKPAVGDLFFGPVAKEPLVAVVAPVVRDGRMKFLLVDVIETRRFQQRLEGLALPDGWSVSLIDGKDDVLAHRLQDEKEGQPAQGGRFVVQSRMSNWSVVLDVPRDVYVNPIAAAAITLTLAIVFITFLSVLVGRVGARRLAQAVAGLVDEPPSRARHPVIEEIEMVRGMLEDAAAARKNAESTQRESERRFRQLFDASPIPLYFGDRNGVLLDSNIRFKQTFGYSDADIATLADWWRRAYPDPEYRAWVASTWQEAVRAALESNADIEPVECRVTCKDGRVLTMVISGAILGDGLLATFFDVTKRKQAEETLRVSEGRLHLALNAANAGAWEWRLDTGENLWSEELWGLYGLEPHCCEPSYEAWLQTVHPDDRESAARAVLEAAQSGREFQVEWRVRRPQGEERWLMSRGRPLRDANGRPLKYIGVVLDMTEHKKGEAALRESNLRLQLALDCGNIGIHDYDPSSGLIRWDERVRDFWNAPQDAPITFAYFVSRVHPDDRPSVQRTMERALDPSGDGGYRAEFRVLGVGKGEYRWMAVAGRTLFEEKRPVRLIGTVQDVTDRVRSEQMLRDSLNEKVALLKEVHHRVKNNLQIVVSLLGLQKSRTENPEALEILQDARNRVRSMALLHEALYRANNLAHVNFAIYIKDLCRQIIFSFGASAYRIKLEQRVDAITLPLEHAVPCGLIINELVTNAIKHAFPDERSGTVTVEFSEAEDGRTLLLDVHDDGVGVPPGMDPEKASTLGLRLVFELAGQLGGRVMLGSAEGGGASFRVVFPVAADRSIKTNHGGNV